MLAQQIVPLLQTGGPGWTVAGVGHARTLRELGRMLAAHPSANVTQLGDYNARLEGVFSSPPINIGGTGYLGAFDGVGHQISNFIYANNTTQQHNGLIDIIGTTGSVKNLTISGTVLLSYVSTDGSLIGQQVGSLAAVNYGTVQAVTSTATVSCASSGSQVGGLIGQNQTTGQVKSCVGNTSVSLTVDAFNCYLANLVAYNLGLIDSCSVNVGSLTAPSGSSNNQNTTCNTPPCLTTGAWMGPIAGAVGLTSGSFSTAIVQNCTASLNVAGSANQNAANYVGALVGNVLSGQVTTSHASGNATGAANVGGLAGRCQTTDSLVKTSYATGNATGVFGNVGALLGETAGTVSECWSSGAATGTQNIGGSIGALDATATVDHLWASGTATATGVGRVGGLFGSAPSGSTIDQCLSFGSLSGSAAGGAIGLGGSVLSTNEYWCTNSSGTGRPVGSGTVTVTPVGESSTTLIAGMPSGFDAKWSQTVGVCGGFPVLTNLTVPPTPSVPVVKSIGIVATAASTGSNTVTMPAGIQAGDIAILFDLAQNTTTTQPTAVTPTGWTSISNNAAGVTFGVRSQSSYLVLAGTEGGSTITGMAAGTRDTLKRLIVFRGFNGTTWAIATARNQVNSADTGVPAQSMAASTTPCAVVARAVSDGGTFASPMINHGDDDEFTSTGTHLTALTAYHIDNNTNTTNTVTGDTTLGVATTCFMLQYS